MISFLLIFNTLGKSKVIRLLGTDCITEEHIRKACEIDKEVYPPEHCVDFSVCRIWFSLNKDICVMAIDDNNDVVGYVTILPVDSAYGIGNESDIVVKPYVPGMCCDLYVASVAIREGFRGYGTLRLLLNGAEKLIEKIKEKGVNIGVMCANVVSPEGRRLCELFGFVNTADSFYVK